MFVCVDTLFFVFVSILFPLTCVSFFLSLFCFDEYTILVEYNLEKFVSVEERYVAGESRPVEREACVRSASASKQRDEG